VDEAGAQHTSRARLLVYRLDDDGAPVPGGDATLLDAARITTALDGAALMRRVPDILGQVRRAWKWFTADASTRLPEK